MKSLVGSMIYLRWKDYGWEPITKATPRLFKKFNYRISWADSSKGPASLRVENCAHGVTEKMLLLIHGCC